MCSKCFRPLVHGNRLHPQQVAFFAASLHPHSAAFTALHCQGTPSSPHSRPAVTLASACIRSQMKLSTCLAPHSSPGGLRLCSKCFRPLGHGNRLHPQQVAFYAVSLELHPTPYRSALPGAALRPAGSICAALLSFSNATARIRSRLLSCSKSAAAFAALFCQVPHTSPEGLRLHKSTFAAMLVSSATALATLKEAHLVQQPAFAASCILPAPGPHCDRSDLAAACLCWTAFTTPASIAEIYFEKHQQETAAHEDDFEKHQRKKK